MKRLQLLLLEDEPMDAYLVQKVLERSGMQFEMDVISGKREFNQKLDAGNYDIIIADQGLPQFSALEAYGIMRERKLVVPFILITGSVSEEFAVSAMKQGISDYILKDRLQRLPSAIENAIGKYRSEQAKLRSEANLRTLFNSTDIGYVLLDRESRIISFNEAASRFAWAHLSQRLSEGDYGPGYFNDAQRPGIVKTLQNALDGVYKTFENNFAAGDEHGKWYRTYYHPVYADEKVIGVCMSITDITEKKNLEIQEKKITADLIERNKALEQFAYIISHNLRGPVANITDISNIVLAGGLTEAEQVEFMEGLNTAVKKLDNVIIDLHDILQVQYRGTEHKEPVLFQQLIDDIKVSISGYLDKEYVDITSNFNEAPEILSLKSYLHSIFYNLISNSIKYRQPHMPPIIKIESRQAKNSVEIIFRDNSMGIDIEKKGDQVFGLYKRFHPNMAEGKGMGLFMVKTQVETLGGKISIASKVNEGTEFKISLPMN